MSEEQEKRLIIRMITREAVRLKREATAFSDQCWRLAEYFLADVEGATGEDVRRLTNQFIRAGWKKRDAVGERESAA